MDKIVFRFDSLLTYPISEHLIIRNKSWMIDSLAATDYYDLKERGITSLKLLFEQTWLDLNIPEFKLRIWQNDSVIHESPVRVGSNEHKYLAMAGRVVDLRTHTGEGTIIRHVKEPTFINPVNNHPYHVTRRDDGVETALPNVPWLEPEINDLRYGQLIHPITNIETLGTPSSNGCIGTSETAAWYLYYHAPVGTHIVIRYDMEVIDENGNPIRLQNPYNR
ncbi:L,D-transpeptidase [Halalkalibaculum sp. DA3122]|uniref:L,D-transpeptidase n=1 Tax=Halalkalibaculum sp. DA3122 TaxID=3373607 RepID=UPI00375403FB